MSRDFYETTLALPDATGVFKALSGVRVTLVPRGATDVAGSALNIYQSDQGITVGPDPRAGGTPQGKAFLTGTSGAVRFWADAPGEYDIVFEDATIVPARINDRVGWNAIPAAAASIPTTYLKEDGGITQKMLSALVVQQQVPLGGVIEWWRPATTVSPPLGFEIADGHQVNVHEFPGISGPVNMPDLRGLFIVGATLTGKTDGDGAAQAAGSAGAPGIRGTGGSNLARNMAHQHVTQGVQHIHLNTMPDHRHGSGDSGGGLYTGNHSHSVSASGTTGDGNRGHTFVWGTSNAAAPFAWMAHVHSVTVNGGTSEAGNIGVGGSTALSGAPQNWSAYASDGAGTQPAGFLDSVTKGAVNWTADPGNDFRPQFFGLLRIMKVRRS
jgi:hypothetical protein